MLARSGCSACPDDRIEHAFYPIYPPPEHAQQVLAWLHATG
jgi:hypothetical protein